LFFLAGHETSASNLTMTLYELSINPLVQQKAYNEVVSILGKYNKDSAKNLTFENVTNLEYMSMVLKETLRKWNPVITLIRVANRDCNVSDCTIPKDTTVMLSLHTIHHDPETWPNPDKFDPERFTKENSCNRHPYAWLPFSAGPRSCIGNKFSLLEMKLALACILQKFRIEPDPDYKLEFGRNITIRPKDPLKVILKLRD